MYFLWYATQNTFVSVASVAFFDLRLNFYIKINQSLKTPDKSILLIL